MTPGAGHQITSGSLNCRNRPAEGRNFCQGRTMRAVVVTVLVALLFSSGCAARLNTAGSDGGGDVTTVTVPPTSEPVPPTHVPPNGPCAVQVNLPEPKTTPPSAPPASGHTPDV